MLLYILVLVCASECVVVVVVVVHSIFPKCCFPLVFVLYRLLGLFKARVLVNYMFGLIVCC